MYEDAIMLTLKLKNNNMMKEGKDFKHCQRKFLKQLAKIQKIIQKALVFSHPFIRIKASNQTSYSKIIQSMQNGICKFKFFCKDVPAHAVYEMLVSLVNQHPRQQPAVWRSLN